MGYVRRVTLRCLCEDLVDDWGSVAEQRAFQRLRAAAVSSGKDSDVALVLEEAPTTACASHPLVAGFRASFESDSAGIRRESISGLSDPHWWKQKVSRWRGAATDAEVVGVGEAWLCAGGLRAAGESRDFYKSFMKGIETAGAERYLPALEDRRVQRVEQKLARVDAWTEQLRVSVLVCISEASEARESVLLHVPAPSPEPVAEVLAHLSFEVHREVGEGEELVELFMQVSDQDHARPSLVQLLIDTAQSVVEPVVDAWRVLPGVGTSQIWLTLISVETLRNAREVRSSGAVPVRLRESRLRLGVQAHYTQKDGIVSATVEGDAVRGLCGRWFVPTSNPDSLPVCPSCKDEYSRLG